MNQNKIKIALRRLFLTSSERYEVIKRCKVSRGNYKCEICNNIFKRNELEVHHVDEINTFIDWNIYIKIIL